MRVTSEPAVVCLNYYQDYVLTRFTIAKLYIHLISSYNISIHFLLPIDMEALVTISLCTNIPHVIILSVITTTMLCLIYYGIYMHCLIKCITQLIVIA
jgi:hypothetical protein